MDLPRAMISIRRWFSIEEWPTPVRAHGRTFSRFLSITLSPSCPFFSAGYTKVLGDIYQVQAVPGVSGLTAPSSPHLPRFPNLALLFLECLFLLTNFFFHQYRRRFSRIYWRFTQPVTHLLDDDGNRARSGTRRSGSSQTPDTRRQEITDFN